MPAKLTLRSIDVRAVSVPLRRPVVSKVGMFKEWPLLLIDLYTHEGVVGRSYLEPYLKNAARYVMPALLDLAEAQQNRLLAPLERFQANRRSLNLVGYEGIAMIAVAGLDMAMWDALAKAAGQPLAALLGGTIGPVPAYNSNGLGIIGAERAPQEARELLAPGFNAIKVRLGYPDAATDLAVARAVRSAIGADAVLMSDFNQGLSVAEAAHRAQLLEAEGLLWLEEPVAADDARGHAELRSKSRIAIQTGENWWGPRPMAEFLAQRACDYAMPDAMKIGGVSGWLRAAALADSAGVPMSSHLYPEISAHLLSITPTRHWLEYVDWAEPVLRDGVRFADGRALAIDQPGSGIAWNEDAVAKFQMK